MRLLEQIQREQFIILKTRYDPWVRKLIPECFPTGLSGSHVYVSGGKSIDKNISLSYWFVIDHCFLIIQWLMIILFFGPEGHMSYSLTPLIFFHSDWKYIKAGLDSVSAPSPWSGVGPLILSLLWILVSRFSFFTYWTFRNPACQASLDRKLLEDRRRDTPTHVTVCHSEEAGDQLMLVLYSRRRIQPSSVSV